MPGAPTMQMRRVVITGIGMVSPLAADAETTWARLLEGQSAARKVAEFEVDDLPAQIACRLPFGDGSDGTYNADDWMEPKEQRKVDDFIVYGVAAAEQALADADWHPQSDEDQIATGVLIGSGIGGIEGIVETGHVLRSRSKTCFALLHSRPADQSGQRPCLDPPQAARPEPFGRHRLFDGRPRHRRCKPPDRVGRC